MDGRPIPARRFLIATGARPRPLDFPGGGHLTDSTDFLNLPSLPDRILFVGGGFVSMEFAHLAARAGATVTVVDRGPRPLKQFDPDLVDLLVDRSGEVGIDIRRDTATRSVEATGDGFRVVVEHDGEQSTIDTDLVVHGAGRVPALSRLGLDATEVETGPDGIAVRPHLQSTTNPAVWGSRRRGRHARHAADPGRGVRGQGRRLQHAQGPDHGTRLRRGCDRGLHHPELARVGMLEAQAREADIDLDVRWTDTSNWFSNYRVGERTAAVKILVDRASDTIVGAHMLGPSEPRRVS